MSSSSSSSLSSLAHSKLHKCSLHRWVLLKNSLIRADTTQTNDPSDAGQTEVEDEEINTEDSDSFMFPDAGKLVDRSGRDSSSEAEWLDSLLETLADDDDDDFSVEGGSILQVDDEYDQMLSPLPSPMSSSDDLTNESYLASSFSYPYLVPYPPFQPPLINFESSSPTSPYIDPLPYYELDDDGADLPVPDAIEDTSDDESDSPLTPSIQSSSSLTLIDPATIPLPADRPRIGSRASPHIYIDSDDSSFYPYELDFDPLPFPDDLRSPYNMYQQEC
ncbi:hypothetical protein EV361DRAFT_1036608 [Lentinula raphanica]|uniref:Uncharacterized protein n=1 Tax=Lentinula raphanica TaxID=153919 RepID=A0AA38PMC2_9AGAR|nr:hypothetical protein F5878DRAFT_571842 [Lentinula raphanica]KAJ3966939.1 hypothetical protein EV361DRAFT_1036608 [Lentinula raphanica]